MEITSRRWLVSVFLTGVIPTAGCLDTVGFGSNDEIRCDSLLIYYFEDWDREDIPDNAPIIMSDDERINTNDFLQGQIEEVLDPGAERGRGVSDGEEFYVVGKSAPNGEEINKIKHIFQNEDGTVENTMYDIHGIYIDHEGNILFIYCESDL